ncbi:hypothetical protein ACLOJK_034926, partial [Asimina triloba]
ANLKDRKDTIFIKLGGRSGLQRALEFLKDRKDTIFIKLGRSSRSQRDLEFLKRAAVGTAAGGATVAGRRHRDGARPATGSHNPQAVQSTYINFYQKF